MTGYYDIHTHILPGVDDGARDMMEAQEMISIAYQEGIRHIVATPHFALGDKNSPVEELREKLAALQRAAYKLAPEMTFSLGNELLDGDGMLDALKDGRALTLDGTRYILLEFLPHESYSRIYASLRNYIMNGYLPIVAHMERYEALIHKERHIYELLELGVLFQMNANSLTGGIFHRRAVWHRKLLEEGCVHFLGSDCHRKDTRPPLMQSALSNLPRNFAESSTGRAVLVDNPAKMLADKSI